MTLALYLIVFFLLLIELDLSNISTSLDKIADRLRAIEALRRSSERIENSLRMIGRQMNKEVDE